jgi:ATP-dependent DNA helicase RecQ
VYDADRYARVAAARSTEQQAMRDYISTDECRMSFLRRQLDDEPDGPCGRCDNCGGVALPLDVPAASLARASTLLHRPGVVLEPRRMWPTGLAAVGVPLTGRIAADRCAEPGRALGGLSDIGWGSRLRAVFAAPDAVAADDLVDGLVRVLASWEWAQRPVAVVSIASSSRPLLVSSLAQRVAMVGRLPLLGEVTRARPAGAVATGSHNSAQRVLAVHDAFRVGDSLAAALHDCAGPVLLVDDRVDSGWTMTVTAGLLRAAGVSAVLPLALATA